MQKAMAAAVVMALVVGLAGPAMAEDPGGMREAALRLAAAAQPAAPVQTMRRSMGRTIGGAALVGGGFLFLLYESCDGFVNSRGECIGEVIGQQSQHFIIGTSMALVGVGMLTIWNKVPVDVRADRHGVSIGRTVGW